MPLGKNHETPPDLVGRNTRPEEDRNTDSHRGEPSNRQKEADDDFDFVVTEAHDSRPLFLGSSKPNEPRDDLGVQSTAELVQKRAENEPPGPDNNMTTYENNRPQTARPEPPPEPPPDYDNLSISDTPMGALGEASGTQPSPARSGEIRRLSEEEIKSINKNLYAGVSYLSDEEKRKLIRGIDNVEQPFANTPIEPAKRGEKTATGGMASKAPDPLGNQPETIPQMKPAMVARQRGIAHYYRHFIHVKGNQRFQDDDQLSVSDREYILRKWALSPKLLASVGIPAFALLLIIVGILLTSSHGTGEGRIVGIVVDERNQPYLQKATIRFPELGKSFVSNAQGFFKTDDLPQGNHKMEYIAAGVTLGIDYATTINGEITTVVLKPSVVSQDRMAQTTGDETTAHAGTPRVAESRHDATDASGAKTQKGTKGKSDSKKQPAGKPEAKIALAANVEGARLLLNGEVLGAGNLTYAKLSPGQFTYSVSKDGFETVSGVVVLEANKTTRLEVQLAPLTQAAKAETFDEDDYLQSGLSLLREGNYQAAITDLSESITRRPSYGEAYFARAEALTMTGQNLAAFDDYLRAAEIFQIRKEHGQAINSYTKAVELDKQAIAPLLGRANVYLTRGEQIAAITDFEAAMKLNDGNAQVHFGLGKARFEQGYYKKAVNHFKDARKIEPDNPAIYQYLMLSYMGANDIKNVKKSYEKFIEVASEKQVQDLMEDSRFAAVRKIIELDS